VCALAISYQAVEKQVAFFTRAMCCCALEISRAMGAIWKGLFAAGPALCARGSAVGLISDPGSRSVLGLTYLSDVVLRADCVCHPCFLPGSLLNGKLSSM